MKTIEDNPKESRKEWQFWQQHNKPIELWRGKVIKQKIDYIHNNPVVAGFVTNPIDWKYSSAKNYAKDDTILKIANEGMHLGTLEL